MDLVSEEKCGLEQVQYIFCSDEYLLDINQQYLNHDYYTDIITFPLNRQKASIVSDIYISVDRIRENALNYAVSFEQELYRVIAHGMLHLCGYQDESEAEIKLMRSKEDHYLQKIL